MRRHVAGLAIAAAIGLAVLLLLPVFAEVYLLFSLTVFAVMAILALSLALVWGYAGILSLGQVAFFGLGGYAYAVTAINLGDSTPALVAAIVTPVAFAALIGYVAFYGRVSHVYFGVISLTLSLILYNLVNATSGAAYSIGAARLGGYNGIPTVPPINMPFDPASVLGFDSMFYFAGAALLAVYLALRVLLLTPFGRIAVAIRENEARAELLGYDARLYKLGVYCIGGAIAGFAGALYAAWGAFIGPSVFSLSFAAQVIIWILLGGLGTLIGPIAGCFLVQALTTWLGESRVMDPNVVLGVIFLLAVLVLPSGIVPTLRSWVRAATRSKALGA